MSGWATQSAEGRALLAPSFSATLLWAAAMGHATQGGKGLPFETSFLVLPLVLHRGTRESFPGSATTSLAVWLDENPLVRTRIAERARTLVPITKEAITFGGSFSMFAVSAAVIDADVSWKRKIDSILKQTSDEVRSCAKRSEFLGKWFAKAGNSATVMALMGVRP